MTIFNIIRQNWLAFFVGIILAVIAGLLYDYFEKPKYESRLTFSIDNETLGGGLSSAANLASQLGLGIGSMQSMFDGDNIIEIMKSRNMNERVLLSAAVFDNKKMTLADYYMRMSSMKKKFSTKNRLQDISFPVGINRESMTYLQDSILYVICKEMIEKKISISRPDKRLSIYEVKVRSNNEVFSKIYTDRIVDTTSKFYIQITSKKDKETLDILEARVASIKNDVSVSIDDRASHLDINLNPAFSLPQTPVMKQQYNIQAYSDAYREMFKNLEMARYKYLKQIPLIQIIDAAAYPMKKIRTGKLLSCLFFMALFNSLIYLYLRIYKRTPLTKSTLSV